MQIDPLLQVRAGERALGAHPRPRPVIAPTWRQRLRFFAGRNLTRSALDQEHRRHAQHLGLAGLRLGAGIVDGLGCRAQVLDGGWTLAIAAGRGLLADGRDVVLDRQVDCRLDDLPVFDPELDEVVDGPPRGCGLLLLQPVQVGHRDDEDAGTAHCRPLEEDLAFADLQLIDGARLGWLPLAGWPGLTDLPTPGDARARNRLAHALFAFEARTGSLPGAEFGLPLAALAVLPDGRVTVCDRHAAWRALAAAPRRAYDRRSPALGQARLLQFADELAERTEAGEPMPGDLQATMRWLPPVGLLPPQAIDWQTRRSDALPPGWVARARPVVEEQLEALLDPCRDLAPLDVDAAEQVDLLIPVPAASYDPELLATEVEDPAFGAELTELVTEVRQARSDRDHLDAMAVSCLGKLAAERLLAHPDPANADAQPEESGGNLPAPDPAIVDHAAASDALLADLATGIEDSFAWSGPVVADLRAGDFGGLDPWTEQFAGRIQGADDAVDQFFLSVRSDIHRLRQVLGGTATASRIGTSPVLAEIAEGAKGLVDSDRLQQFFQLDSTRTATKTVTEEPEPQPDAGGGGGGGGGGNSGGFQPLVYLHAMPMLNWAEFAGRSSDGGSQPPPDDDAGASDGGGLQFLNFNLSASQPRILADAISPTWSLPTIDTARFLPWIGGSGGTLRTRQLVDRVRQPPAIEAKIKASATKARILRALADLDVVVGDIRVVLVTGPIALLDKAEYDALDGLDGATGWSEFQERISATSDGNWASVRVDRLGKAESSLLQQQVTVDGNQIQLGNLLSRSMRRSAQLKNLDSAGLIDAVLQGVTDPDPLDGDESDYVSTAVATLEGAVSVLREVEGRLHGHRLILDRCRKVIEKLGTEAARWLDRLATAEASLAEIRHDLGVARGLYQEEQRRVVALNLERLRILREEVEVVAFSRPRHVDQTSDLPQTGLLPRFEDPLPDILADRRPLPDELAMIVDVVRQIPLGSFPDLAKRIALVDRRERLLALFRRARERARLRLQTPLASYPMPRLAGVAAQSFHRLHAGWQDRQRRLWQRRGAIDPQRLARLPWSGQQREAIAELSLEDLLDGGRDAGGLATAAGELAERIGAVVGALYRRFTTVEPLLRLRWVERVSIHDDPGSLLQPAAVLPGWLGLGLEERRTFEHLIAWLEDRFSDDAEARELASDLVRAAILVAARAPAAELASAHLAEEVRGEVGDEVDAQVDSGTVAVGMIADFTLAGSIAASGRVVDLLGDRVRLAITQASAGARFTLPAGTQLALRQASF